MTYLLIKGCFAATGLRNALPWIAFFDRISRQAPRCTAASLLSAMRLMPAGVIWLDKLRMGVFQTDTAGTDRQLVTGRPRLASAARFSGQSDRAD